MNRRSGYHQRRHKRTSVKGKSFKAGRGRDYQGKKLNSKVWAWALKEARADKRWANRVKNDKKWLREASIYSKEMLKKRLETDVDTLALNSYNYLKLRSHAIGQAWGSPIPIDPIAMKKWEKLTGEKIKITKKKDG